jgi:hypothetical protein
MTLSQGLLTFAAAAFLAATLPVPAFRRRALARLHPAHAPAMLCFNRVYPATARRDVPALASPPG